MILKICGYDGGISIYKNGNITWDGVWSHKVRNLFYKTCRDAQIEATTKALIEFMVEIINPNSNGLVYVWYG